MAASFYPTIGPLARALLAAAALPLAGVAACSRGAPAGGAPGRAVFVPADREAVRRETELLVRGEGGPPGMRSDADAGSRTVDTRLPIFPDGHPEPRLAIDGARLLALRDGFTSLAAAPPDGYADWASVASDGAEAARRGDLAGARASCIACHERHVDRWRRAHPSTANSPSKPPPAVDGR